MFLRQSTAGQKALLGPFVDATDGDTAETGLTIANTDVKLHKGNATTLATQAAGGALHISAGYYYAALDALDTDVLGNLEVHVHVAGARAVSRTYVVLPGLVYDALVLGTDSLGVNVVAAGLDEVVIETGLNARQALSLLASALAGVLSGAATATVVIKGAGVADTRITATVDADGNRSALTLTPPA